MVRPNYDFKDVGPSGVRSADGISIEWGEFTIFDDVSREILVSYEK